MNLLRTQFRLFRSGRKRAKHCERPDCGKATREGKPYCSDHVDDHPYVRGLIEALAAREAEEARVRKRGARAVDLDGVTAREILGYVAIHGGRTVQRLARELNLDIQTIKGYARALERGKRVHLTSTRRGAIIVNPGPKPKKTRKKKAAVAQPAAAASKGNGANERAA
jgi:hypothetical protein